jgi:hypothetical protein
LRHSRFMSHLAAFSPSPRRPVRDAQHRPVRSAG